MKRTIALIATCMLAVGCTGHRAFTRGHYADPNTIELLSDQFNENDLQLIAKKMVESLGTSQNTLQLKGQPVVIVAKLKNSTSEHIDMASLRDKLVVQLSKTGKFRFEDKDARTDVAEEYAYQGSGFVDPAQVKGKGQQTSADYVFTGEISSIVQEVGSDKSVYYKMTGKLTNLRTGILEWTDEKELRKKFEKQGVTL